MLPLVRSGRIPATVIFDVLIDAINHNLSRALNVDFYHLLLVVLLRIISHLYRSRTRLAYHFQHLFRCLTDLLRFFATNVDALTPLTNIYAPLDSALSILAL